MLDVYFIFLLNGIHKASFLVAQADFSSWGLVKVSLSILLPWRRVGIYMFVHIKYVAKLSLQNILNEKLPPHLCHLTQV